MSSSAHLEFSKRILKPCCTARNVSKIQKIRLKRLFQPKNYKFVPELFHATFSQGRHPGTWYSTRIL